MTATIAECFRNSSRLWSAAPQNGTGPRNVYQARKPLLARAAAGRVGHQRRDGKPPHRRLLPGSTPTITGQIMDIKIKISIFVTLTEKTGSEISEQPLVASRTVHEIEGI